MSNELVTITDMQIMAKSLGPLFGKKPEDMFALMLISQSEGKHPAIAAQEYDIIQGRPAINSRSAQARFQASGGRLQWTKRTDTEVSATFSHPQGGELEITWTIERANKAGLTSKENWRKYPAQMLSARVIAEGVRAIFPACLSGMDTSDEVADFDIKEYKPSTPKEKPLFTDVMPEAVEKEPEPKKEEWPLMGEWKKISLEIGSIIGAKDNPESWTQEQKENIDIRGLVVASKDSKDINIIYAALARVKKLDKERGKETWAESAKKILDAGMDIEAINAIEFEPVAIDKKQLEIF